MSMCVSSQTTDWNKVLKVIKSVDDIKQVGAALDYVSLFCAKHNIISICESELLRQSLILIETNLGQKYYGKEEI